PEPVNDKSSRNFCRWVSAGDSRTGKGNPCWIVPGAVGYAACCPTLQTAAATMVSRGVEPLGRGRCCCAWSLGGKDRRSASLNCRQETMMNPIARLLLASLCLVAPLGAHCDDKKISLETSAHLVTSDLRADQAAAWGGEVVRASAASEPVVTDRHSAH